MMQCIFAPAIKCRHSDEPCASSCELWLKQLLKAVEVELGEWNGTDPETIREIRQGGENALRDV